MALIFALVFALTGCAARPARGRVVIPHDCLISVELNEKTECDGPDAKHVRCAPVTLTRKQGCEVFDVRQDRQGGKK